MEELKAKLAYHWESLRLRFSSRRFGLWLLLNLFLVIFMGAFIAFLFERGKNPEIHSYWDALYMTFITIATVGYGDITPITTGGRITIIVSIVFGLGTLSGFITLLATRRAQKARRRYSGLDEKTRTRNHILVCGWNPRGKYVLDRLKAELEKERAKIILLCDLEDSPVEEAGVFFFRGDPTNGEDLKRVNVVEAISVILLADESRGGCTSDVDARTVLAAMTIKNIKPEIKMTAEVMEPQNIHHLQLSGVGEILDTNSFLGNLIARSALHYGLISLVSEMVMKEAGTRIYTIMAGAGAVGRTWKDVESELQQKYGARVLSIAPREGSWSNAEDRRIDEGDRIVVISEVEPPGAI